MEEIDLKKLLLFALLLFAAWKGYEHFVSPSAGLVSSDSSVASPDALVGQGAVGKETPASTYKCDGRQHCTQMNSRAEAEFFVRNCPDTKMDGDRDGEPCENDSRF